MALEGIKGRVADLTVQPRFGEEETKAGLCFLFFYGWVSTSGSPGL